MEEKKSLKMVQNSNWCHFYKSKFFCDKIKNIYKKSLDLNLNFVLLRLKTEFSSTSMTKKSQISKISQQINKS